MDIEKKLLKSQINETQISL